ncbi:hypothetical protein ACE1B6_16445 [Aerosakkonemataceae cyanobacterium BLCC-F154]|uniref:Uncharacterized protein n=1 Tax=Floridaenema fluviatile BLCC-F154 TaxID=3153640 RepID=A0ABV4YG48_9CYAN
MDNQEVEKSLFTELNSEEAASVNGGCYYGGYRRSRYRRSSYYGGYRRSYRRVYYRTYYYRPRTYYYRTSYYGGGYGCW